MDWQAFGLRESASVGGSFNTVLTVVEIMKALLLAWMGIAVAADMAVLGACAYFFGSTVLVDLACYALGVFSLLALIVAAAFRRGILATLVGLVLVNAVGYPQLSGTLFRLKLQWSKEYVARAIPALEEYHKGNGAYPPELRGSGKVPAPPFYLRYGLADRGYEFRLPDSQSIGCDVYVYSSSSGNWWVDN